MPLRRLAIADVKPFAYAFEAGIGGTMTDIGRTLGSRTIGLLVQTVPPGNRSSRRHRHLFQEEILVVMAGSGLLHHGEEQVPVGPGEAFCYLAGDPEAHAFENTGTEPLVIWAFGNRLPHEVCLYPDQGVAFVEGLGAEVPLDAARRSEWTEDRRKS
ncbi:cupin domain-containing protein [Phreatobacter sp.]|uniref:cupin domain-containing protein n=1 Tax=Phreatobacter sp. TaxID=1966341 RepID=UPI003F72916C